ncbi:sulfate transporter [Saccharothrix sp. CB00851]|nr:sulfate transporter [Saccharothrix sp. CB00851]
MGRLRADVLASIVVFLVAVPLCIGIAVASGVQPEAAIITAIVGGIVTGVMPGSSLQVSGPAAGLAVLVFDAVQVHGTATLGMIVLASGVLQIVMGLARLGKWFQAMASSVVAGMLSGIGLLILLGQVYALADRKAPGDAVQNLIGLPALLPEVSGDPAARSALLLGVCGLVVIACWGRAPKALRVVPGPLAAVLVVAVLAAFFHADVRMLSVGALLDAVHLPTAESAATLFSPAVLGTAVVFALIASAESLFGATAVDRMHTGPKTQYNKELLAQGTGNVVSGFLGGIPLTAVVVRSAANVHAGAHTKLSRVLHGVWMLTFAMLAPGVLRLVPITVLAAILVYSGWKLLNPGQLPRLWRHDRGEAAVLVVTISAIIATDLLEGVVIGLVAALFKVAWQMSRLTVDRRDAPDGRVELRFGGSATFLTVPKLQTALDAVRGDAHLDLSSLTHLDRTCRGVVDDWARQRGKEGAKVTTAWPPGAHEHPTDDGAH